MKMKVLPLLAIIFLSLLYVIPIPKSTTFNPEDHDLVPVSIDTITTDWNVFWTKFKTHTDWNLEWYDGNSWLSKKSDLTIDRKYPQANKAKLTLIFDASETGDYRLTFAVDLIVKKYITKLAQYKYEIEYYDYSIVFDWSDVMSIPNLEITHGVKNEQFWFRMKKSNVPLGAHVEIDPSIDATVQSADSTQFISQRKSFRAQGRFWVFYTAGVTADECRYSSSAEGDVWDSPTVLRAAGKRGQSLGIWGNTTHVAYVWGRYPETTTLKFRVGSLGTDGVITWSQAEQTITGTYTRLSDGVAITRNSQGEFFVAFGNTTTEFYLTKSTNDSGLWATVGGFPKLLNNTEAATQASLCAFDNGDVYLTCGSEKSTFPLYGVLWNETAGSWSEEAISDPLLDVSEGWTQGVVCDASNNLHVTYRGQLSGQSYARVYYEERNFSTQTWEDRVILGIMYRGSGPSISLSEDDNHIYVHWAQNHSDPATDPTDIHVAHYDKSIGWVSANASTIILIEEDEQLHGLPTGGYATDAMIGIPYTYGEEGEGNAEVKFVYTATTIGYGGVTITDMEGCGNWLFAEDQYYHFQANYTTGELAIAPFDTVKIRFTDGSLEIPWITVAWSNVTEEWVLEAGEEKVNIQIGTNYTDGDTLVATFVIYLESTILDRNDVTIWQWANDTLGNTQGWSQEAIDYFNIYNLGGQNILYDTFGDAYRIPGGDVFDFYAGNFSWVEADTIYRRLQHIKLLPEIEWRFWQLNATHGTFPTFILSYGIDYCTNETDEWIDGWTIQLVPTYIEIPGTAQYAIWTAYFYNRGDLVAETTFRSFHTAPRPGAGNNATTKVRLWIDLWFNKVNASTTVGLRVTAYEWAMKDSADGWVRLLASDWGPQNNYNNSAMFFDTLKDEDNSTLSTQEIKLIRVHSGLVVASSATYNQTVYVRNYDVFDLTFDSDRPFEGIQTPTFQESRIPAMPYGGFIGMLVNMFSFLRTLGLNPAVLGFFNIFLGFIETVFNAIGNAFGVLNLGTTIRDFLQTLGANLTNATLAFVTLLGTVFTIISNSVGPLTATLASFGIMIENIFKVIGELTTQLNNAYNNDILPLTPAIVPILTIIGALLPFWEVARMEEKGFGILFEDLSKIADISSFLIIDVGYRIITFFVNLIFQIIEAIPVME